MLTNLNNFEEKNTCIFQVTTVVPQFAYFNLTILYSNSQVSAIWGKTKVRNNVTAYMFQRGIDTTRWQVY